MKKYGYDVLIGICLTVLLMYPYLCRNFLPVEHDTFFHVSRIENLSKAIAEGEFLPAVYPYENGGYGYASPLFYSDFFLIVPALLHLAGMPLTACYKFLVFVFTLASFFSMSALAYAVTKKKRTAWLAGCAYLFSNYHITDIYVRGALGETMAFAPLPLVVLGMYRIMYEKDEKGSVSLCLGLSSLALCHNLTFLFGSLFCVILFLVFAKNLNRTLFLSLVRGIGCAFLLTAFYTIPMIEQLRSQKFIVGVYAASSDLGAYSMDLWQYFANRTVFGLAGNYLEHDSTMLENIGIFLTFTPLLYLLVKKKNTFITVMLAAGIVFMILPGSWIPWDQLSLFRVIQFPWRLNTAAVLFLCIPAAEAVTELFPKIFVPLLAVTLAAEGVWHVTPVLSRTFGIPSSMTWQDVLDGAVCDPYYSAYYVRVELAGADYLPVSAPDFRGRDSSLRDGNGNILPLEYSRFGNRLLLRLSEDVPETIVLPLTWYKGYSVTKTDDQGGAAVIGTYPSEEAMASFHTDGPGTYVCMYRDTPLRTACMNVSWITLVLLAFFAYDEKTGKHLSRRLRRNLPF